MSHEELVGLAKQHFSGVSFEYEDDAVPLLSPCRFTGSEVRETIPLYVVCERVCTGHPNLVPHVPTDPYA